MRRGPDSLGRRRPSTAAPSSRETHERIEVERNLLVRVRRNQRVDHCARALSGNDGLAAQLAGPFLPARTADGRVGPLAAEERPLSPRVPRTALVVADPARAGAEHGIARAVERFLGDEPDELVRLAGHVAYPTSARNRSTSLRDRRRTTGQCAAISVPRGRQRRCALSANNSTDSRLMNALRHVSTF